MTVQADHRHGIQASSAVFQAFLAALLFGLSAPLAKLLLDRISPLYMASLLYLGAGTGMTVIWLISRKGTQSAREASISRSDRPWVILMILLDVLAPVLLMFGLAQTTAATASLLNNFEMAATALFAMILFKEAIGRRIWFSLVLVTAASVVLSIDITAINEITWSNGSLLILGACLCWGLENNCTRHLSGKDPVQIVMIKGLGSGLTAFAVALIWEGWTPLSVLPVLGAAGVGFVSYGMSIFFYVRAQRWLGAARTSMYYAAAPFAGALVSYLLLREHLGISFAVGAVLMLAGTLLAVAEKHQHPHLHELLVHEHPHDHDDGHHDHGHADDEYPDHAYANDDHHGPEDAITSGHPGDPDRKSRQSLRHTHVHTHQPVKHEHAHQPDMHHRHQHE